MYQKKLLLFLFVFNLSFSQTFELKGIIQDEQNQALSYANVIIEPVGKANALEYTITNDKGAYHFKLNSDTYLITISYLGFKTQQKKITIDSNINLDFNLIAKNNMIDEVIVEAPISIKEDTISYNTDKFLKGDERKLKNVLEQLPGVEVDNKGNVKLNGKRVKKLLVDGKPFFGGNTRLGVVNIPSDVIAKVTFLDNYNAVSFLKEFSDSDLLVMDISLKKDKKNFIFGDIALGLGNTKHYRNHNNLFFYSPKTSVNFITNFNDTGEEVFTFEDYFSFIGGINSIFKNGFSEITNPDGDFTQFLNSKDLLTSSNKFAALNLSKNLSKKIFSSGYIIFSDKQNEAFESQYNQYNMFSEKNNKSSFSSNSFLLIKYSLDYTPNKNEKIYSSTKYKMLLNKYNTNFSSTIDALNRTIATKRKQKNASFSQNIEWHKKLSNRQTISSTVTFSKTTESPDEDWQTSSPLLSTIIPLQNDTNYQIVQSKSTSKQNFNIIIKHFLKISNIKHLYSTLGETYSSQDLVSKTFQTMSDGTINNFNNTHFNNNAKFRINDLYLGLHYKFKLGKAVLKPGFFIRNYAWSLQNEQYLRNKKILFSPDFTLKINFSKSEKLKFDYSLKSNFSDIKKLTNKFQLISYNSLSIGNINLENDRYHSLNLRYSKFNLYKGTQLMSSLNYDSYNTAVINNISFQGTDYYTSYSMLKNPSNHLNINANYSKQVKKIKYGINFKISQTKYTDLEGTILTQSKKRKIDFGLSVKTFKYKNYPIVHLKYNKKIGVIDYRSASTRYSQNNYSISFNYHFLKYLNLEANYHYYTYLNKGLDSNYFYDMAEAKLSYHKKNNPWSFILNAQNLFDTKYNQQIIVSDYIISDSKQYIQPFSILFSVNYKL
jgi:hypothetical protein